MHIDRYLYKTKTNFNLSRISISICTVKMLKLNNSLHNHINKNEHMLICWGDECGRRVRVRFKRAQSYQPYRMLWCATIRPTVDGANCEWFSVQSKKCCEGACTLILLLARTFLCVRARAHRSFALATHIIAHHPFTHLLSHSAFSIWNIVCQYRQIIRFYSTPLGLFLLISLFILSLRRISVVRLFFSLFIIPFRLFTQHVYCVAWL